MNTGKQQSDTDAVCANDRPQTLSLESIVRKYASAVLGLCLAHTRNIHDGEDMMQEVFLKALDKFHTLRDPSSIRSWLLQIARRTCIDRYRKTSVPTQTIHENIPAHPDDDNSRKIEQLHKAISELPETFREPIMLYYINGRSCTSVAESLGISESAVRSRLSRARLQLHEILAEDSK